MTRSINIAFFSDPGHGWARVPKAKLIKLGIADKITSFSYQRGINVYLEEDCDAGIFLSEMKNRGQNVKIISTYVNDFDEYLNNL